MKRLLASALVTGLLASMLPAVGSAAPAIRYPFYFVGGSCEGRDDGGYLDAGFGSGTRINRITVQVWLDPADPPVDPPTFVGNTGDLAAMVHARRATFSATMPLIGQDGTVLGEGTFTATLVYVGDRTVFRPTPGNLTSGFHQPLAGTGTFTWSGGSLTVDCTGDLFDEVTVQPPTAR